MRQSLAALILASALPLSAAAEGTPQADPPPIDGLEDLADGMRKLLEGFSDDVAPMMEGLAEQLKGLNAYHPPEVLPNGDIIIRRKDPDTTPPPLEDAPGGGIDI